MRDARAERRGQSERVRRLALALSLLTVLLPAAPASAASPWPTIADVRHELPGVTDASARCIVDRLHGGLSRGKLRGDYWKLTRAEKLLEETAEATCMTLAQRVGSVRLDLTREFRIVGVRAPAAIDCVARGMAKIPLASRIAVASRSDEIALIDPLARRCGLLGALFAGVASKLHVPVSGAERRCTNEHGTFAVASKSGSRVVLARVLDRCVGTTTRVRFWRFVLRRANISSAKRTCIARHLAARLTFRLILATSPRIQVEAIKAIAGCL